MKLHKSDYFYFLENPYYIISVTITLFMGYAFRLTNPSISIDGLSLDRYLYGELFAQGRITMTVIQRVLRLTDFAPFVMDFLAILCLFGAAVTFCVLFQRATNDRLHLSSYIFFSCIFVSYPLISEIFVYLGANLAVCLGYLMVAFSLLVVQRWLINNKITDFLLACSIIVAMSSYYESLVIVYICGIFVLMLLRLLFTVDPKYKSLKTNLLDGLKAAIPLILGVVLEFIISMALILVLGIAISKNGDNLISYMFKDESFLFLLKKAIVGIVFRYGFMALSNLPITILNIAVVTAFILMIYYGIKRKSVTVVVLFSGSIFTLVMLTLAQGSVTPYRACQVFGFFSAFVFMLAFQLVQQSKRSSRLKAVVGILACLLVFHQASNLNMSFYIDHLRYQQDVNTVNMVAARVTSEFDVSNIPVVFIGKNEVSDIIKRYTQLDSETWQYRLFRKTEKALDFPTEKYLKIKDSIKISDVIGRSYLPWGVTAFGEVNTELLKFFSHEGFDFKQGTEEMYDEALVYAKSMESWPQQGAIVDMGEFILVNFGV